jgi:competence protein ComEC
MAFRTSRSVLAVAFFFLLSGSAFAQLQIHHVDVGQADGAVVITPGGKVILFEVGQDMKRKDCVRPVSYLEQLGVKQIDALFVSHYHSDHIGCISDVLKQFPLKGPAYDRGGSYQTVEYANYVAAVGAHRKTARVGDVFKFDGSPDQVVISVFEVSGKSQDADVSTDNENDLSLATILSYGQFREEISGDLSGDNTSDYKDVETPVAAQVGRIDVYKVHHHCSTHSTNAEWVSETSPTVAVISVGNGNSYKHPGQKCLDRLRADKALKKVFWTERGNGGEPKSGIDVVGGNIQIDVAKGGRTYTVTASGATDTYQSAAAPIEKGLTATPASTPGPTGYAWSKKAAIYHHDDCAYVLNISPSNLEKSDTPPLGKRLHKGCPTHVK